MNVQLTVIQLWALVAGGPIAMVLTVLIGILINNSTTSAKLDALRSDLKRIDEKHTAGLQRVESTLKSEIQRVEGVLSSKMDVLGHRVNALEDEVHSPLVKQ